MIFFLLTAHLGLARLILWCVDRYEIELNLKFQVAYIGKIICSPEQQVAETFFFTLPPTPPSLSIAVYLVQNGKRKN